MKSEDLQRSLLKALEKKLPNRTELVETLMEILFMEKGAIYRRLRGEVPFSYLEVVNIAEKLNISINNLIYADFTRVDRFELNVIEYTNMNEADYNQWEDYISLISPAKNDPFSEIAESSNILPLLIYGKFDSLSKFFLFKYQYLFGETESRISFDNLVFPERLNQIFHSYFNITKNFAKTVLIWDHLIFRYLVTDILFFLNTNLISRDNLQELKNDLFALLKYTEEIAVHGYYEETGNPVDFYISDVNLYSDYSYVRLNDIRLTLVRALILNSVVSTFQSSYDTVKKWVQSLKKSSTLITQSGSVYRAEFFEKQRGIVAEL